MRYYVNDGKIISCKSHPVMPKGFQYWEAVEERPYYGLSETFDVYFLFIDETGQCFESKAYSYAVRERNLPIEIMDYEDAIFLISNLESNYFTVSPKNLSLSSILESRKIFNTQYDSLIIDVQDRLSIDTNETGNYVKNDNVFNELLENQKKIEKLILQLF